MYTGISSFWLFAYVLLLAHGVPVSAQCNEQDVHLHSSDITSGLLTMVFRHRAFDDISFSFNPTCSSEASGTGAVGDWLPGTVDGCPGMTYTVFLRDAIQSCGFYYDTSSPGHVVFTAELTIQSEHLGDYSLRQQPQTTVHTRLMTIQVQLGTILSTSTSDLHVSGSVINEFAVVDVSFDSNSETAFIRFITEANDVAFALHTLDDYCPQVLDMAFLTGMIRIFDNMGHTPPEVDHFVFGTRAYLEMHVEAAADIAHVHVSRVEFLTGSTLGIAYTDDPYANGFADHIVTGNYYGNDINTVAMMVTNDVSGHTSRDKYVYVSFEWNSISSQATGDQPLPVRMQVEATVQFVGQQGQQGRRLLTTWHADPYVQCASRPMHILNDNAAMLRTISIMGLCWPLPVLVSFWKAW